MEIISTARIRFRPRPMAISISYRMHMKLALIVLILKLSSRGTKASALKIQFFVWALKDSLNTIRVREFVASNFMTSLEFWGLEPALSRALDFAVSEQLIFVEKGSYALAPKGNKFVQAIQKDMEILSNEKAFLSAVGLKVSDNRLAKIATWAKHDVDN